MIIDIHCGNANNFWFTLCLPRLSAENISTTRGSFTGFTNRAWVNVDNIATSCVVKINF
jgi:hypothetical protein